MATTIEQVNDRQLSVNDKQVYQDQNGNWCCAEELTNSEQKAFNNHLKSLSQVANVPALGNISEKDIVAAGFYLDRKYEHDDWYTKTLKKGVVNVDFTYVKESDKLHDINVLVEETEYLKLTMNEILKVDEILNK